MWGFRLTRLRVQGLSLGKGRRARKAKPSSVPERAMGPFRDREIAPCKCITQAAPSELSRGLGQTRGVGLELWKVVSLRPHPWQLQKRAPRHSRGPSKGRTLGSAASASLRSKFPGSAARTWSLSFTNDCHTTALNKKGAGWPGNYIYSCVLDVISSGCCFVALLLNPSAWESNRFPSDSSFWSDRGLARDQGDVRGAFPRGAGLCQL